MVERTARKGRFMLELVIAASTELGKKGWTIIGFAGAEEGYKVVVGDRKFTPYREGWPVLVSCHITEGEAELDCCNADEGEAKLGYCIVGRSRR